MAINKSGTDDSLVDLYCIPRITLIDYVDDVAFAVSDQNVVGPQHFKSCKYMVSLKFSVQTDWLI